MAELDVSSKESADKFAKVVKEKYGKVAALVNNAGVAAKGKDFNNEIVAWTLATNFYGTIYLTEQLTPLI